MSTLVEAGNWTDEIAWELHESESLPPEADCTAAFCVAIHNDRVVLAKVKTRGWGMLGGHIEPGETVHAAMTREALEEGGFVPYKPQVFAHRKITAKKPARHPDGTRNYPFPTSYIVYFVATTQHELAVPTGLEIEAAKAFHIDEIRQLELPDLTTIELALRQYRP